MKINQNYIIIIKEIVTKITIVLTQKVWAKKDQVFLFWAHASHK